MEEEIDISKDPSFADYFKTFSSLMPSIKELIDEILSQNNKKNDGIYDLVKEKNIHSMRRRVQRSFWSSSHRLDKEKIHISPLINCYVSFIN